MDKYNPYSAWVNPSEWPAIPHGYVLIIEALERIGGSLFGGDWLGCEFGLSGASLSQAVFPPEKVFFPPARPPWRRRPDPTPWRGDNDLPVESLGRQHYASVWHWHGIEGPLASVKPPTRSKWREARERWAFFINSWTEIRERRQAVVKRVQDMASAGALQFAALNWATGQMLAVPAENWNCGGDILDARIARGRVNLIPFEIMRPLPDGWKERQKHLGAMTSWLFVPEANLSAVLKELSGGDSVPRCSTPMLIPGGVAPIVTKEGLRPAKPSETTDEETTPDDEDGSANAQAPIAESDLRRWFAQRVKAFGGKKPPTWKECHAAAKEAFPTKRITKDALLSARRIAAPEWRQGRR